MNVLKIWRDLTVSDRNQVVLTLLIIGFFAIVILYSFLVSRGQDVDYFKERLGLMEQRLNYMDQKLDKTTERQGEIIKEVADVRRKEEVLTKEIEDNRKWMEYWKSLPHLPKPPQKR